MEELTANELAGLGAANIHTAFRGLHFEAQMETLYRINYRSRLASRVLAPLKTFLCHNTEYLYRQVKALNWSSFLTPKHTFAVFSTVSHSAIKHSRYAALCVKDGIADHFRERLNSRPNVLRENPDLWINVHIENNVAAISIDTSGGPLNRRGYREETVKAPMQETLAAAVVRIVEWDGRRRLFDPFCGSGTLLAEVLMDYCKIPAGFLRSRFGFEYLPDFDKKLWHRVKEEEKRHIRPLPESSVSGSDVSPAAIKAASTNLKKIPFGDRISLSTKNFHDITSLEDAVILCNPPHGIRLKDGNDISIFYKDLGDFFKQRCKGSLIYLYVGNRELIPHIGLKPSWKKALFGGGLDGRLVKFEIY